MKGRLSRIVMAAACTAALSCLVALRAAADVPSPAIGPALTITPESAVVTGAIDTGDLSPGISYTFEYDTLSDWRAGADNAVFVGPFFAGASTALTFARTEIGCFPAASCTVDHTPLLPSTVYVYQLQAQPAESGTSASTRLTSVTATFRTGALGTIALRSRKLTVARGRAAVELRCTSSVACRGTVTLKLGHAAIASRRFSVTGSTTLALKLSSAAMSKLASGSLSARAVLVSTTDQKNISEVVSLRS